MRRTFDDVCALEGVSLTVGAGEVVGLLGHNGAGKTTAVRLVTGILAPDSGRVRVHGRDPLADGPTIRRTTGVVSATPAVDDRLTARQSLAFVGDVFGVDHVRAGQQAEALLDRLELADRADERVGGFSSGMRQRLALARTVLPEPLLVLDEPTAALDPVASREVRDLLARLAREEGRSVLLCSHHLVEAQQLCDRVIVLDHGRVIADGAPAALAARLGIGRLRLDVDSGDRVVAEAVLADVGTTVEPGVDGQLWVASLADVDVPALVAALVAAGVRVPAPSTAPARRATATSGWPSCTNSPSPLTQQVNQSCGTDPGCPAGAESRPRGEGVGDGSPGGLHRSAIPPRQGRCATPRADATRWPLLAESANATRRRTRQGAACAGSSTDGLGGADCARSGRAARAEARRLATSAWC